MATSSRFSPFPDEAHSIDFAPFSRFSPFPEDEVQGIDFNANANASSRFSPFPEDEIGAIDFDALVTISSPHSIGGRPPTIAAAAAGRLESNTPQYGVRRDGQYYPGAVAPHRRNEPR
jgi:hypothetical protein